MKERPILFSGPMVCAILDGRKTVTRRIIKDQDIGEKYIETLPNGELLLEWQGEPTCPNGVWDVPEYSARIASPFGVPGDRLWVKETWKYCDWTDDGYPYIRYRADDAKRLIESGYDNGWGERLSAIWADLSASENYQIDGTASDRKWRPSIFMPRWASRISLEVVLVRAERLREITDTDAKAEGVKPLLGIADEQRILGTDMTQGTHPYTLALAVLWDTINGDRALWSSNPWVWRVEFKLREATKEGAGDV